MFVCVCNAVNDRQIREAVREGACTMRELRLQLGVSANCGKCGKCAYQILQETLASMPPELNSKAA